MSEGFLRVSAMNKISIILHSFFLEIVSYCYKTFRYPNAIRISIVRPVHGWVALATSALRFLRAKMWSDWEWVVVEDGTDPAEMEHLWHFLKADSSYRRPVNGGGVDGCVEVDSFQPVQAPQSMC